jgi:hypothetical protein
VYVYLTPHGRALKGKLVPLAEEVNRIATRGVPPEEVAAMRRALGVMLQNLAADAMLNRFSFPKPARGSRISGKPRGSARHRGPA